MSGEGSPCHEESYVIVFDGAANEKIMKGDDQRMFAEMMHGFHRTHQSDYKAMVKGVRKKGVLKWVAGDKGNVIFDTLCVGETTEAALAAMEEPAAVAAVEEPVAAAMEEPAAVAAVEEPVAAAMEEPAAVAAMEVAVAAVEEPVAVAAMEAVQAANPRNARQSLVCKRNQPYYLRPATPGMARQLGSAKTRAFVNGGRLPGQGSCGNYCVSRLSSTSLSAIDIAKSRALAQFL